MSDKGNFLASGPAVAAPKSAPAQQNTAPYVAPVSDGSSQGPMIGDRRPITRPEAPKISVDTSRVRKSNDVSSGMATALGAMADKMHPVKRR
jgi:hypothetical protein